MKLLLAVDGSSFSHLATEAVTSQIRHEGTEILVLQIVEDRGPELGATSKEHFAAAQQHADQEAAILRKAGFKMESRIKEGEARVGIVDVAGEWHADVIVLGSHGRTGLSRFLLGSVAEAVARHAKCSVLIVRAT